MVSTPRPLLSYAYRAAASLLWPLLLVSAPSLAFSAPPPKSSPMTLGEEALPPLAYVEFCRRYAGECDFAPSPEPAELTDERWQLLVGVNTIVNKVIRTRKEPPGKDDWLLGVTEGDCDDYVAEKRHHLIARGFPSHALSFTEVRDTDGNGHLVLVAHTNHGAYVLDNMRYHVLPWTSTGYQFVKMSSPVKPQGWVEIRSQGKQASARGTLTDGPTNTPKSATK